MKSAGIRLLQVLSITVAFFVIFAQVVKASSTDTISFQSKLVKSDGTNITNGTYNFRFLLYSASSGGAALWTEDRTLSVSNGVVSLQLGAVTSFPATLFDTADLFLQVCFDANGTDSDSTDVNCGGATHRYEEVFSTRKPITSVPVAFRAKALTDGAGNSYTANSFFKQGGNTFGATGTIGTIDNNALQFIANNLVGMTLTADGSVGIGTATPGAKLQVSPVASQLGMIIQGAASQSVSLTEWRNSSNFTVASMAADGELRILGSGSAPATSYSNAGGMGARNATITITTNLTAMTGSITTLLNGVYGNEFYYNGGESIVGKNITFDFKSPVVIDEAKYYQDRVASQGIWKWQVSNNATDWTDIGATFDLGTAVTQTLTTLNGNVTAYRYYRLYGVSGATNWNPWVREYEFKISAPASSSPVVIKSGYIGIGTLTPTYDFHLEGSGTVGYFGGKVGIGGVDNSYALNVVGAGKFSSDIVGGTSIVLGSTAPSTPISKISGVSGQASYITAGNVGIGTTSPTAKFHIVGTADTQQVIVKANTTQTTNIQEWQSGNGDLLANISAGGMFAARGDSTNAVIMRAYPLTGTNKNRIFDMYSNADINNSPYFSAGIGMTPGWVGTHAGTYVISSKNGTGVTQNLYLLANDTVDATNGITIQANTGRVGIGDTAPPAKLSLGSDITAQKILVYDSDNYRYGLGIQTGEMRIFSASNGNLSFGALSTADGSTYTENVRITAGGNVGIGTVPTAKLHIYSAGGANSGINLQITNASSYGTIDFNTPTGLIGQFLSSGASFSNGIFTGNQIALAGYATNGSTLLAAGGSNGYINFATGGVAANNERMRIASDGKVGIGLTSPAHLLDVNGNIGVATNGYVNFGSTDGSSGYGIRSNSGQIEFKDLGGNWTALNSLSGSGSTVINGGLVASVTTVQTRQQAVYTVNTTGDGTVITPLNIVMTPKKAGNKVILEWVVNGEANWNMVFLVSRNGVLLPSASDESNTFSAGIATMPFDTDVASTQNTSVIRIVDENSLGIETTYSLLVRSSYTDGINYYLNRTVNGTGATNETSLSSGTATEINSTGTGLLTSLGFIESGATPTYSTVFQAGDQSADITYTLPTANGNAGTFLTNDGTGKLSWASAPVVLGTTSNFPIHGEGGTPIASSNFPTLPPSLAYDNDISTSGWGWVNNGGTSGFIGYNFSSPVTLVGYTVYPYNEGGSPVRTPKDWIFEASNNGTSWTTLDTQTNQTTWTIGKGNNYTFTNNTGYTYYRLNFSSNNGDASYSAIAEMRFFASAGGTSDWTKNALAQLYYNGGNVGIGTSSPSGTLEVVNTTGNAFTSLIRSTGGYTVESFQSDSSRGQFTSYGSHNGGSLNGVFLINSYGASDVAGDIRLQPGDIVDSLALIVKRTGNVGIGRMDPAAKLDVAGNGSGHVLIGAVGLGSSWAGISLNGSTGANYYNLLSAPNDSLLINHPAGTEMSFRENNVEQMVIKPGGNVGIGTNTATHKLTVMGSGYFLGDTSVPNAPADYGIYLGRSLTDENRRIEVVAPDTGVSYFDFTKPNTDFLGRILYDNNANKFSFYTNATSRMVIDSAGNVGIGTGSPLHTLQVNGALKVGGDGDQGLGVIALGDDLSTALNVGMYRGTVSGAVGHGNTLMLSGYSGIVMTSGSAPFGSQTPRMAITATGNVGIGTTSPASKLHVVTSNDTSGATTAYDDRYFTVGQDGAQGGAVYISYDQTNGRGYIGALSPNIAWRNLILAPVGGNVGVGDVSPAYKLSVTGTGYFHGGSTAGAIFGSGTIFSLGSDAYMLATGGPGVNVGYTANRDDGGQYASFDLLTGHNISVGWSMQLKPGNTGLQFFDRATGATDLYLQPGGNIGVGTATPVHRLDVNGNIGIASSGYLNFGANDGSTGYGFRDNSGIIEYRDQSGSWTALNSLGSNISLSSSLVGGVVASVTTVQTREQGVYATLASGDGTPLTPLNIVMTPKKAGNKIILEWVVSGEAPENVVYLVSRNGVLLPDSVNASNNYWSGVGVMPYDNNYSSTPDTRTIRYIDNNSLDVASTYRLLVRSSNASVQQSYYLNRSVVSAGGDYQEALLSTGTATEIGEGVTGQFANLQIEESGATPTYTTIFQGGDQNANITYTLPTINGAAGTFLSNDGSGNLSWSNAPVVLGAASSFPIHGEGGTPFASTFYSSRPPIGAFDNDISSDNLGWVNNGGTTGFIGYQFPTPVVLTGYTVYPYILNGLIRTPKTWTFEGSNNGATWTVLDTRTNQTTWTAGTGVNYMFANQTGFTYYRLNFTENNGDSYSGVAELRFFASAGGVSDWTKSGSSVYYTGGNVGIGTTTPAYSLDVVGSLNASALCIAGTCQTSWPTASGTPSVYRHWDPDAPPVSSSAYNDEFSDSSINAVWTKTGAGTVSESNEGMTLTNMVDITRPLPAGDFSIWTKLSSSGQPTRSANHNSLLMVQAGNGTIWSVGYTTAGGNSQLVEVIQWSNFISWSSTPVSYSAGDKNSVYVSIRRSGTTLSFWVSEDGISYSLLYTIADPGVDKMGFLNGCSSTPAIAVFDFIRYTPSYHDVTWNPEGQVVGVGGSGLSSIGDNITNSTVGGVLFAGAGGTLAQNASKFFWDNTTNQLGIGTNTPSHTLDITGNLGLSASSYLNFGSTDGGLGYGIRDNNGVVEFKDQSGTWIALNSLSSGGGISGGVIAQVKTVQTRTQASYTAPTTGDGVVITPMSIIMTPKKAGNEVILEWNIQAESNNDLVYLVSRNGVLLPNVTDASNNRWAGAVTMPYDIDNDSTMSNVVIRVIDENSLSTESTYELRIRSSSGSTKAFTLNRTINSTGQDSYETSLSTGVATEIGSASTALISSLQLLESGSNPTYTTTFEAADQSQNITYTLPSSSSNGLLRNTNGSLSWDAGILSQGGNAFSATYVLGATDSNPVQFITNNTTAMTIDTSGNVGIGTTSPSHKLDINGNIGLSSAGIINFGSTDGNLGYGLRDNGGVIEFKDQGGTWTALNSVGGSGMSGGVVAQVKTIQTRDMSTYSVPISGDGVVLTPLNIVITPKKAGDKIVLRWVINYESHYNVAFLVSRNGVLLPNATDALNNTYANIAAGYYDQNIDSTPTQAIVEIVDENSLDIESTYSVQVRMTWNTPSTFYLNRTALAPSSGYESLLSTGTATEIGSASTALISSLQLLESGTSPTYTTTFEAADQSQNITYTLPATPGTDGQVLTTDSTGHLSWTTPNTGSAITLPRSDVTAARAYNTTYQNTTTSPILVTWGGSHGSTGNSWCKVGDTDPPTLTAADTSAGGGWSYELTYIVEPGEYYRCYTNTSASVLRVYEYALAGNVVGSSPWSMNGVNTYFNGGNVGIGTTTPSNSLSFGNTQNQTIGIESSAADTVGRALQIAAGSTITSSGVSNVVGGDLVLSSGAGTGSGANNIVFNTNTQQQASASILVVGGGGGGGANIGGGGGAGGYRYIASYTLSASSYNVVVGQGGAGGTTSGTLQGQNGEPSSFGTISASGGGGGGYASSSGPKPGSSGGSGGGAGSLIDTGENFADGGVGNAGGYSPAEGNRGGQVTYSARAAAGGGGASGPGGDVFDDTVRSGGPGVTNSISGTAVGYAGGGGGGGYPNPNGGSATHGGGAGGTGSPTNGTGTAGTANTGGGGGGGGGGAAPGGNGGAGGSGVVIIRYKTADATCTGGTATTDGAYTVQTFTASGTLSCTYTTDSTKAVQTLTEAMRITNTGNIGIGVTNPTFRLQVNGATANTTGVWTNYSDQRLKHNINPISNALDTVLQLKGVTFNWNDTEKDTQFGTVRGFIAQDVEKVIPEWVVTDSSGYKAIQPIGIEALLVEAIKAQQVEIDELKNGTSGTAGGSTAGLWETVNDTTIKTPYTAISSGLVATTADFNVLKSRTLTINDSFLIDDAGNASTIGNVTATGLFATTISGIGGTGVSVKLANAELFTVQADGTPVLSASVQGVKVTNLQVNDKQAGTITIPAGTTSFVITTPYAVTGSVVVVTPNKPVQIGATATAGTITITLKDAQAEDITCNWMIVNVSQ